MNIKNIAVHHTGGTASNPHASSAHLTPHDINEYHRQRWNFESSFIPGSFGGYNFIYDPKTRQVHQFRAIGEETAAQIGHNFDTISICIIGNFAIRPGTSLTVDRMTKQMEDDITLLLLKLLNGTTDFIVAPDTVIDLAKSRVHPHRYFQPTTECYGGLTDRWVVDLVAGNVIEPVTKTVQKRTESLTLILSLLLRVVALLKQKEALERTIGAYGAVGERESCEGYDFGISR